MKQLSFSSEMKQELLMQVNNSRHCRIAELSALIEFIGQCYVNDDGEICLKIVTENNYAAKKCFTLIKKAFNIVLDIQEKNSVNYSILIGCGEETNKILQAIKINVSESSVTTKSCCKRAYIRGAFLAAGSVSDPEKFYHFEIVCVELEKAKKLQKMMKSFDIDAKIVERKSHFVVYIKDGSGIVEVLNIMEAHVSLMKFENVRILKEMRGSINRKVNCETANINKTVSASLKQIEDIEFIKKQTGFSILTDGLAELAELRLKNPDITLKELGAMLNPPIGKSGVNHKFRKISELADLIRNSDCKEEK